MQVRSRRRNDIAITSPSTPSPTVLLSSALAPEWRQAADDVHVATLGGEFAGYAARGAGGFELHDSHGLRIGVFATLPDAQGALRPPGPAPQHLSGGSRHGRARRRRRAAPKLRPAV